MSERFILESVNGETSLELIGKIPRGHDVDEAFSYVATLAGRSLTARETVHAHQPGPWSHFFRDLAEHWRGWTGTKSHESLEGNLRLSCTSDRLGHVTLRVQLRGDMGGADWRAENSIDLEAGGLDALARAAEVYFG